MDQQVTINTYKTLNAYYLVTHLCFSVEKLEETSSYTRIKFKKHFAFLWS